jgi:t-SNARE complex subunit (syntaxin)
MNEEDVIEQLQWQVVTLKETMNTLNQIVHEQQPTMDTLEDVILASKQEVQVASTAIVTADHYQSARNYYYYVAGFLASVGTTVALLLLL